MSARIDAVEDEAATAPVKHVLMRFADEVLETDEAPTALPMRYR